MFLKSHFRTTVICYLSARVTKLVHNQQGKWLLGKPRSDPLEEFVVCSVYSLWCLSHDPTPRASGWGMTNTVPLTEALH